MLDRSRSSSFADLFVGETPVIAWREGGVTLRGCPLRLSRLVVVWCLGVASLGTGLVYAIEWAAGHPSLAFIDVFFVLMNCVTCTGFATIDPAKLHPASQAILLLAMQLGGSTLINLLPVVLRCRALGRLMPPKGEASRRFNLTLFERVPAWHVEYKSLALLIRVVLAYHALVCVPTLLTRDCAPHRRRPAHPRINAHTLPLDTTLSDAPAIRQLACTPYCLETVLVTWNPELIACLA